MGQPIKFTLRTSPLSLCPMSSQARSLLFQTLSALPPSQFEQLRFALNPPPGLVPEGMSAQGNRVAALLSWVEGPTGCRLEHLYEVMEQLFPGVLEARKREDARDAGGDLQRTMSRMTRDRLSDVEAALRDLYEQLAGQEQGWRLAEEAEKARIKQKIRLTWNEIRKYEQEYSTRLSQRVKRQEMPEATAEIVVAELVEEVELLQTTVQQDEVKTLLGQILAELQKPSSPASAKLKVAIPLIPSLVTYELEGDTESVVRRLFPTFVKVYEAIAPKK